MKDVGRRASLPPTRDRTEIHQVCRVDLAPQATRYISRSRERRSQLCSHSCPALTRQAPSSLATYRAVCSNLEYEPVSAPQFPCRTQLFLAAFYPFLPIKVLLRQLRRPSFCHSICDQSSYHLVISLLPYRSNMETISNAANTASKMIWGEGQTATEPKSGETGQGTKSEPFDAGNASGTLNLFRMTVKVHSHVNLDKNLTLHQALC